MLQGYVNFATLDFCVDSNKILKDIDTQYLINSFGIYVPFLKKLQHFCCNFFIYWYNSISKITKKKGAIYKC